jgi:hypothetical protein
VLLQVFVPKDISRMWSRKKRSLAALCSLVAGFAVLVPHLASAQGSAAATAVAVSSIKRVDFRGTVVSHDVQHIAEWAVHSGDHQRLPFIIVDKVNATASAFDARGRLIRITPVLLGIGVGDTFAPGVVDMDMYQTQPWQRITPAGRFFAEEDLNLKKQRVLWVDYDTGIAIHKLPAKRTSQKRHERIVSPNPADHRITYGCINVPPTFYDQVVHPHFGPKGGIVYVLPDTVPVKSVFKSYDVGSPTSLPSTQQSANDALPAATRRF